MKQPLFSTSYAPRDGESTLDEIESKQEEISILQSEVLYASLLRRDRADFGVLCIPPEKVYSTLRRLSLIVILSKLIAGFE